MTEKPIWPAPERNKIPILAHLETWLAESQRVLEIGTGTGQHAVHFAAAMPHLTWQCSDQRMYLDGIRLWLQDVALTNLPDVVELDVMQSWLPDLPAPQASFDAIYTANTFHIMPWQAVLRTIEQAGKRLPRGGRFVVYGPFNMQGAFTSQSNADFDVSLRQAAAHQGIRDIEKVNEAMIEAGFELQCFEPLPANNYLGLWHKVEGR